MRVGPSLAAKLIAERIDPLASPRPVVDVISDLCLVEGWSRHPSEARECAERWQPRVQLILKDDWNSLVSLGRLPFYCFNSSSGYMIQGAAFVEPRDSEDVREAKLRVSRLTSYAEAIFALSPRQFELLCGFILARLGVRDPVVTRYSADEGIDFYGRLEISDIMGPLDTFGNVERQLAVWIVGQAKRYLAPTSTFHIRELVGTVELAKAQTYASQPFDYVSPPVRVCDPIFYMFLTAGRIGLNAWRLIEKSGVIGMDGQMIAAFLARHIDVVKGDDVRDVILSHLQS